jgi:hypothetical protein
MICDQNCVPIMRGGDTGVDSCVAIIRVEDGSLRELRKVVKDIFSKFTSYQGGQRLPPGSVLMTGSLAYLAEVGVHQYAEELVSHLAALRVDFGNEVAVIPAVFTPIIGIHSQTLVQDLFDLDTWICASGLGQAHTLAEVRDCYWSMVVDRKTREILTQSRRLFLPHSIRNPRKIPFTSQGLHLPLPVHILSENEEEQLANALSACINAHHGTHLNTHHKVLRETSTASYCAELVRVFVVGASHADRIAGTIGAGLQTIRLPRWSPGKDKPVEIADALKTYEPKKGDIVYLDLLSSTYLMGSDSDGMPVKPTRDGNGRFHLVGHVEGTPTAMLKKIIKDADPIIKVAGQATIVAVSPLPRFLIGRCCGDSDHVSNFSEPDFEQTIHNAVKHAAEVLSVSLPQGTVLMDNWDGFGAESGATVNCSRGVPVFSDPVHLTTSAYMDIGRRLTECFRSGKPGAANPEAKRQRMPSIITGEMPAAPAVPAWIRGEREPRGGTRGGFGNRRGSISNGGRGRFRPAPY